VSSYHTLAYLLEKNERLKKWHAWLKEDHRKRGKKGKGSVNKSQQSDRSGSSGGYLSLKTHAICLRQLLLSRDAQKLKIQNPKSKQQAAQQCFIADQ
jgi:hypothetical protein